jgi:hypothetical protein
MTLEFKYLHKKDIQILKYQILGIVDYLESFFLCIRKSVHNKY